MKLKVMVDMDGVLTDFNKQLSELLGRTLDRSWDFDNDPKVWAKITKAGKKFWSDMEWMPDGKKLWDAIKEYKPTILSSPSNCLSSEEGKKEWLKRELPDVPYIIERKKEKYAKKDAILIDDREKNIEKWEDAGGIGILHKNAESTIKKLNKILDRKKEAAIKTAEDPSGKRIVLDKARVHETFSPARIRRKVIPSEKVYSRERFDIRDVERQAMAGRVVLAHLKKFSWAGVRDITQIAKRPIVIDPYDSIVQSAVRELGPDLRHVEVIKLEPTCLGNRLAWVTNQDLIKGQPGKQRVIHLCLKKIKDKFKGQYGEPFSMVNISQQTKLKDIIKQLLKDVVLPHEAEHVRQELEHGGEFGPSAEPEAERAEEWRKLEQMGISHK